MMTRGKRRALFYVLCIAFLGLGAGVTLYAQGYRLDPETLTVNKIGAIYIRSFPGNATMLLDGRPIPRPFSLFGSGVLANDLFPKAYTVSVTAEGYHDWVRNVTVQPSRVVDFKYAVLVPITPEAVATTTIADFRIIESEPLLKTSSGTVVWRNEAMGTGELVTATRDGNRFLLRDPKANTYSWVDLQVGTSTPLAPLFRTARVTLTAQTTILPDEEDSSRLIIKTLRSITLLELQTGRTTVLTTSSPAETIGEHIASSRSELAWTLYDAEKGVSDVVIMDKGSGIPERQRSPLPGTNTAMSWNSNGLLGILQSDGTFYLYEPATRSIGIRANDAKGFAWSENGLSLAALENRSVEVFSFRDQNYWRLNLPDMGSITRLEWYKDNRHLIVHYPDRVSFIDLDDPGLENIVTIAETKHAAYDPEENTVYFVKDDQLFRLRFPE